MHKIRTISLPEDLDQAVEDARGHVPRSLFYKLALQAQLEHPLPPPDAVKPLSDSVMISEKAPRKRKAPSAAQRKANQRKRDAELEARQAKLNKPKGL